MIRRVAIDGYKSLRNVNLELQRLTIVLGPNASGKSNLFDALHLLSRMVTSRSLSDAFEDHRGDPLEAFTFSEGGLSGLLRQEQARFTIEVDVELSKATIERTEDFVKSYRLSDGKQHKSVTEHMLRYKISVGITPKTGVLRVLDESLEPLVQEGEQLRPSERRRPFLSQENNRLRLRMEGQARPMEYEIGLSYTILSQPVYPPHYPHLVALREELSRWQFYYFEPRQMREENPVKETSSLTPAGGDLAAFYYTLQHKNPSQFDNLVRALQTLVPSVQALTVELTEEGKVRLAIQEHNVSFSAKVISEGTLRLLGLLALLSPTNPATVVGFEEPENGVHPQRLKLIGDLLNNASEHKQVLVNTHSPLLPEHLRDAYLMRCYKENGSSRFERMTEALGMFRTPEATKALEEPTPLSQRILRGD